MAMRLVIAALLATTLLSMAAMRRSGTASTLLQHSPDATWARVSPHLPGMTAGLDGFAMLLRRALAATELLQSQATTSPTAVDRGAASHAILCTRRPCIGGDHLRVSSCPPSSYMMSGTRQSAAST